jgi:phage terminase small subunit
MADDKLTPRQQAFADHYLADPEHNATAAYKACYPSCKTESAAAGSASRMLRIEKVASYIAERRQELLKPMEITAARVLQELAKIAFADVGRFARWRNGKVVLTPSEELTPDETACVAEVSQTSAGHVRFKLHDKAKALDLLGRHFGMFQADDQALVHRTFIVVDDLARLAPRPSD